MKIQNKISIDRMARDREVNLDFSTPDDKFMNDLLEELNDGLKESDYNLSDEKAYVKFEGKIRKSNDQKYDEYLVLEGFIEAAFYTLCVGSGTVMLDRVEADVKSVIIDKTFEQRYSHEEDTTLFIENDEFELYYFDERGEFELKEILNEYLFINKDPYPRIASFKGVKPAF